MGRTVGGVLQERPANGQLKEKGTYKDGEWDGLWKEYYRNGQLSEKGIYEDGEPHGPFEGYSKNGQLEWKGTYNMGEDCGEWLEGGEEALAHRVVVRITDRAHRGPDASLLAA